MDGRLLLGSGLVLIGVGVVWTLQGLGILAGSVMSGVTVWAIIGPVAVLIGVAAALVGAARMRTGPRSR